MNATDLNARFLKFKDHYTRPSNLNDVVIESARLFLRPIELEFAEIIFQEFTPEITKYMFPPSPKHINETIDFISQSKKQRERNSDLVLVILEKMSREFLGVCGLHLRDNQREPELGIWIKKTAHGSGYGKEAVISLYKWAISALDVDAFIYPVDKSNYSSRRIPELLKGVIVEEKKTPTMNGGMLDEVVYRIPV